MADVSRTSVQYAFEQTLETHSADVYLSPSAETSRVSVQYAYQVPGITHSADLIIGQYTVDHSADLLVGGIDDADVGGYSLRIITATNEPDIGGYSQRIITASNEPDIGGYSQRIISLEPWVPHGADVFLLKGVSHSADVNLAASFVYHTADVLLQATETVTHNADVLLPLQHSADVWLAGGLEHYADVLVLFEGTVSHSADAQLAKPPTLRWELIDSTNGVIASGTVAASGLYEEESTASWDEHTHDLTVGEAGNITDYTDLQVAFTRWGPAAVSWVEMDIPGIDRHSIPHEADILVEAGALGHGLDVLVLDTVSITHNADVIPVVQSNLSHSADLFLANQYQLQHSANVIAVRASQHAADLLAATTVSIDHDADLILEGDGIIHDIDILLVQEVYTGPIQANHYNLTTVTMTVNSVNPNTTKNTKRRTAHVRQRKGPTVR